MIGLKARAWVAGGALLLSTAAPMAPFASAQNRGDHGRGNYYGGMRNNVRQGNYGGRYGRDDHHHGGGGIGPGYGALIGAGGGAALGAVFGGGLKGTLIGGAAGAGLGALGGKLAQGNNDHHHYRR